MCQFPLDDYCGTKEINVSLYGRFSFDIFIAVRCQDLRSRNLEFRVRDPSIQLDRWKFLFAASDFWSRFYLASSDLIDEYEALNITTQASTGDHPALRIEFTSNQIASLVLSPRNLQEMSSLIAQGSSSNVVHEITVEQYLTQQCDVLIKVDFDH